MANKELEEILKSQIEENRIPNEISINEKKTVFDIVDLDQKPYNTDKDIYFGYNF